MHFDKRDGHICWKSMCSGVDNRASQFLPASKSIQLCAPIREGRQKVWWVDGRGTWFALIGSLQYHDATMRMNHVYHVCHCCIHGPRMALASLGRSMVTLPMFGVIPTQYSSYVGR